MSSLSKEPTSDTNSRKGLQTLAPKLGGATRGESTHYAPVRSSSFEMEADSNALQASEPCNEMHWSDWALTRTMDADRRAKTVFLIAGG